MRRGDTDPEEVERAAKRMKKFPEHLRSARDSDTWKDFLIGIGVKTSGAPFWEDVREEVVESEVGFTPKQLERSNIIISTVYRDNKGKFTKDVTENRVIVYRSAKTGRFVSPISI